MPCRSRCIVSLVLLSCEILLFLAVTSSAFVVPQRCGRFFFFEDIRFTSSSSQHSVHIQQQQQQQQQHAVSRWKPLQVFNNDDSDDSSKPKIRFSGIDLDRSETTQRSPVDLLFSSLTSDVTSIALGTIGLLILLVGRLVLDDNTDATMGNVEALGQATRVNLLAAFGCGAILLNGVSKLDIQSAMAERVQLVGINQPRAVILPVAAAAAAVVDDDDNNNNSNSDAAEYTTKWVLESLFKASPASSVVLLQAPAADAPWQIRGYVGIVPESLGTTTQQDTTVPTTLSNQQETPILDRLRRAETESYLPTLQALPGRFEFFAWLPPNTQAVLLLPVVSSNSRWAVALGANQARCFTPRDIAWCQVVANRLVSSQGFP